MELLVSKALPKLFLFTPDLVISLTKVSLHPYCDMAYNLTFPALLKIIVPGLNKLDEKGITLSNSQL